jgi:hypothetical protein
MPSLPRKPTGGGLGGNQSVGPQMSGLIFRCPRFHKEAGLIEMTERERKSNRKESHAVPADVLF